MFFEFGIKDFIDILLVAFVLYGTTVLDTVALMKGAHILRVHDVREAVEAVRITEKLKIESGYDK